MLNFTPTEEQVEIQKLARSLALDLLRPQGRVAEQAGCVPEHVLRTLFQTGLATPLAETSDSFEAVTAVLIAEELSYGDSAIALHVLSSLAGALALALTGTREEQALYLAPLYDPQEGPRRSASLAFAERGAGYRLDEISTTLTLHEDALLLHGCKRGVVHGALGEPRVVLARLESESGPLCAVRVPSDTAGLRVVPQEQRLGLQAAPEATLYLEQARLDRSCLLGTPGDASVVRAATLYQLLRAGIALGCARAGLEYASAYARERNAFGRPIASYQGIAFLLAEMAMQLDATRLLLWQAAVGWDQQVEQPTLISQAQAAQARAVRLAKQATIDAVQVLGGAGFIQDHPVEMWMRNAAALD